MQLYSEPFNLRPGMWYLPARADSLKLLPLIESVIEQAPLRHMEPMRGFVMSVAMTNCGDVGWVSDRRGYRYDPNDPLSGKPWPPIPPMLKKLALDAALEAGYPGFEPDVCLVNCYQAGAQMGAHQDVNEIDYDHPIVSVSLGIPARFFFLPGAQKKGKSQSLDLNDGDIVVFGGDARTCYHGVRKLKPATHLVTGNVRWNLTFRHAR